MTPLSGLLGESLLTMATLMATLLAAAFVFLLLTRSRDPLPARPARPGVPVDEPGLTAEL